MTPGAFAVVFYGAGAPVPDRGLVLRCGAGCGGTEGMKEQLEKLGGKAAKGDAIRTRMDRELETCCYDDPLLHKKFSEQVKETLAEYRASRNDDAYLFKSEQVLDYGDTKTVFGKTVL